MDLAKDSYSLARQEKQAIMSHVERNIFHLVKYDALHQSTVIGTTDVF